MRRHKCSHIRVLQCSSNLLGVISKGSNLLKCSHAFPTYLLSHSNHCSSILSHHLTLHAHTHSRRTVMNKTHCHEHRTFCKRVREITSVWLQPAARHSTCIVQPDPAGLHSRSPAKSVKPSSDNNSISILNYITASCLAFNFPNSPVSACPPQLLCSCKRLWMEICTNTSRLWSSPALQPTFARYLNCSCSALLS